MLLNQYERSENEYKTWREKQKQSRDDCQPLRTVRDIFINFFLLLLQVLTQII